MKSLTLLFVLMLIGMQCVTNSQALIATYGITNTAILGQRLLYSILHASWLHLAINIYSLLVIAFLCRSSSWQLLAAYLIAISIPSVLLTSIPMVGASVMVFALVGMLIPSMRGKTKVIALNLSTIIVQGLVPGIAWLAHLYGLVAGLLVGYMFVPTIKPKDVDVWSS